MAGLDTPLVPPALEPALLRTISQHSRRDSGQADGAQLHDERKPFPAEFTTLVGVAPLEYINRYRIHRSLNLLRSTSEPIQNIAARTGFLHHDVQPGISALRRAESLHAAKKCPKAHEWACGEKPDGRFARK